jgi:hypothetical protein
MVCSLTRKQVGKVCDSLARHDLDIFLHQIKTSSTMNQKRSFAIALAAALVGR